LLKRYFNIFTVWVLFLPLNQQCHSTEGKYAFMQIN